MLLTHTCTVICTIEARLTCYERLYQPERFSRWVFIRCSSLYRWCCSARVMTRLVLRSTKYSKHHCFKSGGYLIAQAEVFSLLPILSDLRYHPKDTMVLPMLPCTPPTHRAHSWRPKNLFTMLVARLRNSQFDLCIVLRNLFSSSAHVT